MRSTEHLNLIDLLGKIKYLSGTDGERATAAELVNTIFSLVSKATPEDSEK